MKKKIFILAFVLLLLCGCSCSKKSAREPVEEYLNNYKGLSDDVLVNIDNLVKKENLENEDKETYKEILKRQYRDLQYSIEDENYDGDKAFITAIITVYDLYKANKNASTYLSNNKDKFLTNGEYDASKYITYKLNELKNIKDTINYSIVFKVDKIDGQWVLEQPDDEVLEKIHGIYNYELDS